MAVVRIGRRLGHHVMAQQRPRNPPHPGILADCPLGDDPIEYLRSHDGQPIRVIWSNSTTGNVLASLVRVAEFDTVFYVDVEVERANGAAPLQPRRRSLRLQPNPPGRPAHRQQAHPQAARHPAAVRGHAGGEAHVAAEQANHPVRHHVSDDDGGNGECIESVDNDEESTVLLSELSE